MIGGLLKKILGDKSDKDRKEYQPIIDKVNEIYASLSSLSDDELRNRTSDFQEKIKAQTAGIEKEIEELNVKANDPETPVLDKEDLFEKIDKLQEKSDEEIEKVLEEILPDAFATVKETARRWAENGQMVVTATDFDRDLAKTHNGLEIDDDKAIWKNKWSAAGTDMEWVMIH
jgi:preprotein translocase subunit SecA